MEKSVIIERLSRDTRHRAVRESIVSVVMIAVLAMQLPIISPESPRFVGTIVLIASLGFIMGVWWSYVIGRQTLTMHSESDDAFWLEVFQSQARLLWRAPVWYLTPLMAGVLIFVMPATGGVSLPPMLVLVPVVVMFAGLTWVNRYAARKLDQQASVFA